jgi:hypothetical protein
MTESQLVVGFLSLCCLGIGIYGALYMVGGPAWANWFARGANRTAQRGVRYVGRTTGRTALRNQLVTGIIVITVILAIMSKC